MIEAKYYTITDPEKYSVRCGLCPHMCRLNPDETGLCRARRNIGGKLFSLVYGEVTSVNIDPIEKKPLYHFHPGKDILSVGTSGCNFRCLQCQNSDISQADYGKTPMRKLSPEQAIALCRQSNSFGIAYTYNEPLINFEWVSETSALAKKNGLKNVLVSNGYINEKPLMDIVKNIDAANIDVKSFRDDFYKKVCSGRLGPVMRTVEIMFRQGVHIEITCLIIPKLNDSEEEIREMADWLSSLSPEIPLHLSRYFPSHLMKENATPFQTMEKARRAALLHLKHVYLGNVREAESSRTFCPKCSTILIERTGYSTEIKGLSREGRCKKCGSDINVVL